LADHDQDQTPAGEPPRPDPPTSGPAAEDDIHGDDASRGDGPFGWPSAGLPNPFSQQPPFGTRALGPQPPLPGQPPHAGPAHVGSAGLGSAHVGSAGLGDGYIVGGYQDPADAYGPPDGYDTADAYGPPGGYDTAEDYELPDDFAPPHPLGPLDAQVNPYASTEPDARGWPQHMAYARADPREMPPATGYAGPRTQDGLPPDAPAEPLADSPVEAQAEPEVADTAAVPAEALVVPDAQVSAEIPAGAAAPPPAEAFPAAAEAPPARAEAHPDPAAEPVPPTDDPQDCDPEDCDPLVLDARVPDAPPQPAPRPGPDPRRAWDPHPGPAPYPGHAQGPTPAHYPGPDPSPSPAPYPVPDPYRPLRVQPSMVEPSVLDQPPVMRPPGGLRTNETADSLTADVLLPGRHKAPSGGWRRAVYQATGGLIRAPQSAAEMRRRELTGRARTPVLAGHHRVAVMSLKGGVGKTTTTVGLGATLASVRGDRVIAVDANPDRGTLSDKLRLETAATVRDLLNERDQIQRYADVRGFTTQAPSRLEILASDRDPTVSVAFSEEDYYEVAQVLEHYYSICLADCGTGLLHSAMAGVLRLTDQIVLVSSPSVDGARSASATLDWLQAHGYGDLVRQAVVVLSVVRPRSKSTVDMDRLEQHFAARCRAVVRIPYDPHLEEGAEVDLAQLNRATADAYLALAAEVGDGFAKPRRPAGR